MVGRKKEGRKEGKKERGREGRKEGWKEGKTDELELQKMPSSIHGGY